MQSPPASTKDWEELALEAHFRAGTPIKAVAWELGFDRLSEFCAHLRRFHGVCPRRYPRLQNLNDPIRLGCTDPRAQASVLDYQTLIRSLTNYTFQADTT